MAEIGLIAAFHAGFPPSSRVATAVVITVIFAILGRIVHGVTLSGAFIGALAGFALYAGAGPGAFLALVTVFAITWLATRVGYRRKLKLGTAEEKNGRTASQVVANLATAAVCGAVYGWVSPHPALLLAVAASLAEAAADTVSSELGQVSSSRARLITTWREIPAGTDGGVTWVGSFAGLLAATTVSFICFLAGMISRSWIAISIVAAFAGMIADSYLGALLERRKLLNNDAVNFLSTVVAAGVALLLC